MQQITRTSLCVLVILITACSNTNISNTWVAPGLKEKDLKGVLVVAVTPEEEMRVSFENRYTRSLKAHGVRAVASHTLINGVVDKSQKDQIIATAQQAQLDTLLVSHYAGTDEQPVFHRGKNYYAIVPDYGAYHYNRRFSGYYGRLIEVGSTPDVWTTNKYVFIVSDLYQTNNENHLWQATSETISPDNKQELIDASIKAFVKQMKAQELIQ